MEKQYLFRGLDVRSNQLERQGNTAKDCSNVRLDFNNKLIKREEFSDLEIPRATSGTNRVAERTSELPNGCTILDIINFNSKLIILVLVDSNHPYSFDAYNELYEYDIDSDTLTYIPNNSADRALIVENESQPSIEPFGPTFTSSVTHYVENNVLFMQPSENDTNSNYDSSGTPRLLKYDGLTWNHAGVPYLTDDQNSVTTDEAGSTTTPPDYYARYIPMIIDNQGNQILGTISERFDVTANTAGAEDFIRVEPAYNDQFDKIGVSYAYSSATLTTDSSPQASSSAALTHTIDCSSIIAIPGQYVMAHDLPTGKTTLSITGDDYQIARLKIISIDTSVTPSTATLGEPAVYIDGAWVDYSGTSWEYDFPADFTLSACLSACYYSTSYDVGYEFLGFKSVFFTGSVTAYIDLFTTGSDVAEPFDSILPSQNLEDYYDTGNIKGNPPPAKALLEYGNGITFLIDDNNLYYSDLSLNGKPENFTAFDNIQVGSRDKGNVVSFFANETFIAVFRERDSYLVTGNIFTGNYRIQSYRSTGIGGASSTGVIEVDGQCLFMSNRGPNIALENGTMSDSGNRIEPIFTDGILSLNPINSSCVVKLDEMKEVIYMFFRSSDGASSDFTILYDYRNNEWFKYDGLSARGGLEVDNDSGVLYYSDGTDIFKEESAHTYTNGVDAYWFSNYDTNGVASLKKRFQRLVLFLTEQVSGTIGFKSYKDWDDTTPYTNEDITPSASQPLDMKRCNPKRVYSNSFYLSSEGTNIMKIDGFEYQLEDEQAELNDGNRQ